MAVLLLFAILAVAAGIRFWRLGAIDTRADEVQLWRDLRSHPTVWSYARFHFADFKTSRVMPLPRVSTALLVRGLRVEPSLFWIRVPYALCGILCVWAFFRFGTALQGRRLGLVLAALAAVNPYAIYWSRVAHVYSFMLCFMTLSLAFFQGLLRELLERHKPRRSDAIGAAVSTVLASYTHLAPWALGFFLWAVYLALAFRQRRDPAGRAHVRWALAGAAVWGLTLAPWGVVFLSSLAMDKDPYTQYFHTPNTIAALRHMPFIMLWGGGFPRGLWSLLLPALGLAALVRREWRLAVGANLAIGILSFVAIYVMLRVTTGFHIPRYYSPVWTVLMALSGIGVCAWTQGSKSLAWNRAGPWAAVAVCALVMAGAVRPVGWLMALPAPGSLYSRVNRWMDNHLPKGTLVVVTRWFEPWNEMLCNAPSNVVVTFTVPDEPQDALVRNKWPEAVQNFFDQYQDAAYLDLNRRSPVEGREWEWPSRHFRRVVAFTNEEAIRLGRLYLEPVSDIGPTGAVPGHLTQRVHYNTREDALDLARAAGRPTLLFYGAGWGYTKLWQQFQDFRDWRILEDRAVLDIYNLLPEPCSVAVRIRGMAANGAKRVRGGSIGQADFRHLELAEWRLEPVRLEPGLNTLELMDELWRVTRIPLLVDRIEVEPAGAATPPAGASP